MATTPLVVAAAVDDRPLLLRLSPTQRAGVLLALLGIVIAGVALVGLAWWAGRYYRRLARRPLPPATPHADDWYQKRLASNDPHDDDSI